MDLHEDASENAVMVYTRYSTTVNSMPEAWQFVMARIDAMGEDPSVHIEPVWTCFGDDDEDEHTVNRQFVVVLSGDAPEDPEKSQINGF